MADYVYIANAALDRVGQAQLVSLNDNTTSARKAKLHIYESIRQVLRGGKWKAALKQSTPAQLTDMPLFQWDFAYQLPDDFIRVYSVVAQTIPADAQVTTSDPVFGKCYDVPEYEIQGKTLLCDDNVVQLNYVCDLTMGANDVNVTDANLTSLFILKLAINMVWAFQQSATQQQVLIQEYNAARRTSLAIDAQDSKTPQPNRMQDSEWLRERFTSTAGS